MRWFALLPLFLPLGASAGPGHRRPGPPPGPPPLVHVVTEHADEIGVDGATLARVRAVADAERATHRGLRDELRSAHDALRAAMEADHPDPDAVLAASAQLGAAETALRNHRLETDLLVIAELTPEQWATLRSQRPMPPPHRR